MDTWRSILSHNLQCQYLLFPTSDITALSDALIGVHSAREKTPAMAFATRLNVGSISSPKELLNDRSVLTRAPIMRSTIHLIDHRNWKMCHEATLRYRVALARYAAKRAGVIEQLQDQFLQLIDQIVHTGTVSESTLKRTISEEMRRSYPKVTDPWRAAGRLIRLAWDLGDIRAVDISDIWGSEIRQYRKSTSSVNGEWNDCIEIAAQSRLIEKYVLSYGPVSIGDIAWWTGLPVKTVQASINGSDRIRKYDSSVFHKTLYTHCDMSISKEEIETNTIFLSYEDNLLKGYKETRARFGIRNVNEVYYQTGEAKASVIHDGIIVGTWAWRPNGDLAELNFFQGLTQAQVRICVYAFELHLEKLCTITRGGSSRSVRDYRVSFSG